MVFTREECRLQAKFCEHAERYEDMAKFMSQLIKGAEDPLNEEERNLLSVAYKHVVGARRSSWRVVAAKIAEEQKDNCKNICQNMRTRVEDELNNLCDEVLGLLDKYLIPKPENTPAHVFYLKMKGDYFRYKVEIAGDNPNRQELVEQSSAATKQALVEQSQQSYEAATKLAQETLPTTSTIRLGLALNYSVFYYEVLNQSDRACSVAKTAFDDAIQDLDSVTEDVYKDSTLIMQLLRDNLTQWKSEQEADDDDD